MTTELLIGIAAVWLLINISGIWLDRYRFYRRGFFLWGSLAAIITPADPFSIFIVGGPLFCLHFASMWVYHLWRRMQPVR